MDKERGILSTAKIVVPLCDESEVWWPGAGIYKCHC